MSLHWSQTGQGAGTMHKALHLHKRRNLKHGPESGSLRLPLLRHPVLHTLKTERRGLSSYAPQSDGRSARNIPEGAWIQKKSTQNLWFPAFRNTPEGGEEAHLLWAKDLQIVRSECGTVLRERQELGKTLISSWKRTDDHWCWCEYQNAKDENIYFMEYGNDFYWLNKNTSSVLLRFPASATQHFQI